MWTIGSPFQSGRLSGLAMTSFGIGALVHHTRPGQDLVVLVDFSRLVGSEHGASFE